MFRSSKAAGSGPVAEADAELRERRAEAEDARSEVYYDVRMAFSISGHEEELKTARVRVSWRRCS